MEENYFLPFPQIPLPRITKPCLQSCFYLWNSYHYSWIPSWTLFFKPPTYKTTETSLYQFYHLFPKTPCIFPSISRNSSSRTHKTNPASDPSSISGIPITVLEFHSVHGLSSFRHVESSGGRSRRNERQYCNSRIQASGSKKKKKPKGLHHLY